MALVGDVIVRTRNVANDPCQTLAAPLAPTGVSSVGLPGIFTGTIYFVVTFLTTWGETLPGPEASVTVGTAEAIGIAGINGAAGIPAGATGLRFYYSGSTGTEQQYLQYSTIPIVFGAVLIGAVGDGAVGPLSGVPPYKSSAFLPDTDGDIVGASDIYRWMNAGLVALGRLAGGILDQTGIAMLGGSAEVIIPGWWLKIQYTWHNGWLVLPEQQSYTWLQANVQGIPGISTLWRNGAQQVIGTWPQPSISAAFTTLTAPMGAGDSIANCASTTGLNLTDGVMNAGSGTLTSVAGGFAASMVGLAISVAGAGPLGATLNTTIQNYVTTNQVLLSTNASVSVTGATVTVSGSGAPSFTSPGMCQIDNEIMSFSQTSPNQLVGLVRGYAGTIATAHLSGAKVSQLILRLLGRRMPVPVAVGQSANVLDLPQGWDEVLDLYLLSKFKATEQNEQEAAQLLQQFQQRAVEMRDDNIPLQNKQIGGLWPIGGAAQSLAEVNDTVIVT